MNDVPRFEPLSGLSGSLLIAHPSLHDPNFEKTVVLLSVHSEENGALGIILNRPTGKTLGELYPEHSFEKLAHIEVFQGGPVDAEQLILTAWKWDEGESTHKMFFGISGEHAMDLLNSEEPVTLRGYLGYAGWSAGQLETELASESWITKPLSTDVLEKKENVGLWNELLNYEPEKGSSEELPPPPKDPSLN